MTTFLVFALIGLFVGAAARVLYPGRQPIHILGTMLLGIIGGLAGGLISWGSLPAEEGQFHSGNLLMSVVGAIIVIGFWAGVSYARNISGYRTTSR
jgi:uncharacterized membrane protein YeaQ/YmgE (transglycosylase-associated protein family)